MVNVKFFCSETAIIRLNGIFFSLKGTSPIEMAAPYDLRDATPIEEFTAPSDADFLGRIYFSLQYDAPR
jgi:hypothetical protein